MADEKPKGTPIDRLEAAGQLDRSISGKVRFTIVERAGELGWEVFQEGGQWKFALWGKPKRRGKQPIYSPRDETFPTEREAMQAAHHTLAGMVFLSMSGF